MNTNLDAASTSADSGVRLESEFNILSHVGQGNNFAATGYVRFLLATIVLMCHSQNFAHFAVPPFTDFLDPVAAVCAFFLLSGWVISASVERQINGFYKRRAERLMPVYLACLCWAQLPWHLFGQRFMLPGGTVAVLGPVSNWVVIAHVFFLQNYVGAIENSFYPAWSLSSEVFYYALAPLLKKISTRYLAIAAGIAIILCLLKAGFRIPALPSGYGFETFYMAWAWLAGFIGFRVRKRHPLLTVVILCSMGAFWNPNGGYLVLLTAGALLFGHHIPFSKTADKIGVFLGDLSYPLYLSHVPTLIIVAMYLPASFHGRTMIALSAAIIISIILQVVVDAPLQRFFKRGRFKANSTA
jgi:peptidoglycan/LPS O-acetylase OafA/YrhL